jgi:hypothetical protein
VYISINKLSLLSVKQNETGRPQVHRYQVHRTKHLKMMLQIHIYSIICDVCKEGINLTPSLVMYIRLYVSSLILVTEFSPVYKAVRHCLLCLIDTRPGLRKPMP